MTSPTRARAVFIFLLVLALSFTVLSCGKSASAKVKVRTGTRVVCKYGEVLEDNTRLISVPKSEVSKYKVRTVRKLCLKHRRAESLYKQGEGALAKGETERAQEAFKKIMELDPKFRDTKKRLASVNETIVKEESVANPSAAAPQQTQAPSELTPIPPVGSSSSQNTQLPGLLPETAEGSEGLPGGGETTTSPDTNASSGTDGTSTSTTSVDLVLLLPGSLTGYRTGELSKSETFASRDYSPEGSRQQLVEFLLMSIHKLGSRDEAKTFVDRVSRKVFYANAQEVQLQTDRAAYYGTDEKTYANMSWYEGNIVYEIMMMSATGSPNDLYNEIVEVAKQVP
jgi:hypothetical protein